MMKKQTILALALLLLIPIVAMAGGFLFSTINPEIAAGHAHYERNYHLLSLVKTISFLGSGAVAGLLWLLICFLVIRSKGRSWLWLFFAGLGPVGLAVLAMLSDTAPLETDWYARFVRGLNRFVRAGYEICTFVVIWVLAYQAMVLMRYLIILYESATTGTSTAIILDRQNASSGMWAFGEGMEVMYIVALLYLLWPIVFNVVSRVATNMAIPKAR